MKLSVFLRRAAWGVPVFVIAAASLLTPAAADPDPSVDRLQVKRAAARIDALAERALRDHHLTPNGLADDATWARRTYLAIVGRIPTADEVRAYVRSKASDKSYELVDELLAMEIKRSQRYTKPFAVILMDIDNFKSINDRFGHLKGDYVLMEVAQILRTCVRGADYIIRYGGDEFIMLLPDTDQEGAEIVVERLQKKITDWDTRSEDGRFELTISAGISIFTQGREAAELVTEADQRMYEAKRSRASASSTQATS